MICFNYILLIKDALNGSKSDHYCIFDQINAPLVIIRDLFQKRLNGSIT